MPRRLRALRHLLPVFFVGALTSGCASTRSEGAATPAGSGSAESAAQARFLADCREGCDGEASLCERFCTCSAAELEASPELTGALAQAEEDSEDGRAALQHLQVTLVGACGAELYEHHFVRGCIDTCTDDGAPTEGCTGKCECLYGSLRQSHPGREGLTYLARAFGAKELPADALEEIERVRPACGF